MCFTLKGYRNKPRPEIAKEDIKVYKEVTKAGYGPYYSLYINEIREKWTPGTHYIETTPFKNSYIFTSTNRFIVEGNAFHSYIEKPKYYSIIGHRIIELIIPKGAKYYKNEIHYVSSEIIYP